MKNLLRVLVVFLFASCSHTVDFGCRYKDANLSIPKNYKLLKFSLDSDIGETEENYLLRISKEDYIKISNEIKNRTFFEKVKGKKPIYTLENRSDFEKIIETACWFDNKFFYEIFIPKDGKTLSVILEKDSLMTLIYNDL